MISTCVEIQFTKIKRKNWHFHKALPSNCLLFTNFEFVSISKEELDTVMLLWNTKQNPWS